MEEDCPERIRLPTTPKLERDCGEKAEESPHTIKRKKRKQRARGTEERLKTWRRDARDLRKMAKQRAKATTAKTTSASVLTKCSDKQPKDVPHGTTSTTSASVSTQCSDKQPKDMPHVTVNTTSASVSTKCSDKQPAKDMSHGIPERSDDDLVDFRGLAILPRCYSSLLEKACIGHPDIAVCPKRSLRWREFAYETLGELLFFLTSTRRKEMIKKSCEHLQILWEEAQGLGFDLSWLTPTVNSCLAIDSSNPDVNIISANMEALKKHKNTLHCQLTTLTMQLIDVNEGLSAMEIALQRAKEEQERFLFTGLWEFGWF